MLFGHSQQVWTCFGHLLTIDIFWSLFWTLLVFLRPKCVRPLIVLEHRPLWSFSLLSVPMVPQHAEISHKHSVPPIGRSSNTGMVEKLSARLRAVPHSQTWNHATYDKHFGHPNTMECTALNGERLCFDCKRVQNAANPPRRTPTDFCPLWSSDDKFGLSPWVVLTSFLLSLLVVGRTL